MPEVIADTSSIQYLHQTDLLDLLPTLYQRILIPQAVVDELTQGRRQGIVLPNPETLS
jgi:predicted nucleic acid-binding protein